MESLAFFMLASIALIVTPGPDIIYVLTRGIADGKRSGVMSAIGVTAGILVHTMAAALGLAVLLKTSTYAFWTLKVAGGIYLMYLGYQVIKNKKALEITGLQKSLDIKKCFLQGFLSNVLNPKVALFFVAFLPQFINKDSANQSLDMIIFGLIFAVMTILFLMVLGLFAGGIGIWLKQRKKIASKVRIGSGTVLILLGLRLIVPQKNRLSDKGLEMVLESWS
jgi:threonine/homoserine/homoserine lactone efflux protein